MNLPFLWRESGDEDVYRIAVLGMGKGVAPILRNMKMKEIESLVLIDNDIEKQGAIFYNRKIYSKDYLLEHEVDYIFIASKVRYEEISCDLEKMGIKREKIVQIYNYSYLWSDSTFYNDELDCKQEWKRIFYNLIGMRA